MRAYPLLPGQTLDARARAVPIPAAADFPALDRAGYGASLRRDFKGWPVALEAAIVLERELDAIWPGWRRYEPHAEVAPELRARIQWLLKRRELLWVQGRDWGVHLAERADRPGRVYAHPVEPPDQADLRAEYYRRRDLFGGPAYTPPGRDRPSGSPVPALARKLGVEPAFVQAALSDLPPGSNPELWIRHKLHPGGAL